MLTFLAPGDSQHPIIYDVETLREGHNFSALRVKAIQHKNVICHVTASFQVPEEGSTINQPYHKCQALNNVLMNMKSC